LARQLFGFSPIFLFSPPLIIPSKFTAVLLSAVTFGGYMSTQSTPTIPATGFLRLNQVLQFVPIGKTRWYAGLKSGEFPQPVALGPRAKGYRAEDIRSLIERLGSQTAGQ
jgi:predicted DNA-binding transcriptional regulator AlpA